MVDYQYLLQNYTGFDPAFDPVLILTLANLISLNQILFVLPNILKKKHELIDGGKKRGDVTIVASLSVVA